jgi:hypothetical protein
MRKPHECTPDGDYFDIKVTPLEQNHLSIVFSLDPSTPIAYSFKRFDFELNFYLGFV